MHLLALFASTAFAAECDSPVPTAIYESQLSDVEAALNGKNLQQMSQMLEVLQEQLPCLMQPLSPAQAGRTHLIYGVEHWISKDLTKSKMHFSSVKASAPDLGIPTEVFPSAHQIHETFSNSPSLIETEPVAAPEGATLWFDGIEGSARPTFRPTIYQFSVEGRVEQTQLLAPGSSLPVFPSVGDESAVIPSEETEEPVAEQPVTEPAATEGGNRTLRLALGAGAGASALAAGGLLYMAYSAQKDHAALLAAAQADPNASADGSDLVQKNKTGQLGAAVAGAAAVGLGVAMVVTW
jgi:hypothetical protein